MAMHADSITLLDAIVAGAKTAAELVPEVTYVRSQPIRDLHDLFIAKFNEGFDNAAASGDFDAWRFLPTYPSYTATSTSSVAIGTGTKTFTVAAGKAFKAGQTIRVASTVSPTTKYMTGTVTSYASTTLVVNVTDSLATDTLTAWTITVSVGGQGGADDVTP